MIGKKKVLTEQKGDVGGVLHIQLLKPLHQVGKSRKPGRIIKKHLWYYISDDQR